MNEKKTTDSQIKASRNWEKKNRKKATIASYRRTARSFIRNHANEEDIEELRQLLHEREKLIKEG
ncbi:MAG TPA: hypothetical protein VK125_00855 [Bacillota bacterium]|nr:hypothetical protein [Bacillota bacterium]